MDEYPDRRVWSLAGYELEMITLAYALTLYFTNHPGTDDLFLQIESPFTIRSDGAERTINSEEPETIQPILTLLRKPVHSLTAYRTGRLVLEFSNGTVVAVAKDDHYESWNTTGTGELASASMLCSPHAGPPWAE